MLAFKAETVLSCSQGIIVILIIAFQSTLYYESWEVCCAWLGLQTQFFWTYGKVCLLLGDQLVLLTLVQSRAHGLKGGSKIGGYSWTLQGG